MLKTVKELNPDQILELKRRLVRAEICDIEGRPATDAEVERAATQVQDERIFKLYRDVKFSDCSFWQ